MEARRVEPVVRIRCRTAEEVSRCARILAAAGYAAESSLTALVVRDAHPDEVNEALVSGGALARVSAREEIGKLIGYVIDRGGDLTGCGTNLRNLVGRVLAQAGLPDRYAPLEEQALLAAAGALHEQLMASGAAFVTWERFLALFCSERRASPVPNIR